MSHDLRVKLPVAASATQEAVPTAWRQKNGLEDLAVFGGDAAFATPLHVGRPNIGNKDVLMARIEEILDRRWLTNNGPCVQELELRVAAYLGVRNCIAVCNATIGLEILARALGLSGEVIIPSFTFIATAHALSWLGIRPVFCDVDPRTHTIDVESAASLITPRTSAIMGVHLWGRSCDVAALTTLARARQLQLIFDAAHGFGCSHRGTMIGNFGTAEVVSFHATKFFNTFEGGAVLTNDDDLAGRIRLMRNFGFRGYDDVCEVGTNGKMNEICAAMGLTGLEALEEFIGVNRRNYELYRRLLSGLRGLRMVLHDSGEQSNYQYIVVEIDERVAGVTREQLYEVLWAENVMARRYFYPGCHLMEPYRSLDPSAVGRLPVTEALTKRVLVLPTGTAISADDVRTVAQIVQLAVAHAGELTQRLAAV